MFSVTYETILSPQIKHIYSDAKNMLSIQFRSHQIQKRNAKEKENNSRSEFK